MKKFTEINNTNKTVETSNNKKDFIKNLIDETLTIDNNEIKGKDVLYKAFETMLNMNESKTTVSVLESVKAKSFKHLNLNWINESIETERKKINNPESFKNEEIIEEPKQELEIVNENVVIDEIKDNIIVEEKPENVVENTEIKEETKKLTLEEEYNTIMARFDNKVSVSEDTYSIEMTELNELFNKINSKLTDEKS